MMLPMRKLGIATNANDILTRFWKTGTYAKVDPASGLEDVKETLSPAMDITVSSNFERLLWYLAYQATPHDGPTRRVTACRTVAGWMAAVKKEGKMSVSDDVLRAAREDFIANKVDDQQVRALHCSSNPITHYSCLDHGDHFQILQRLAILHP